MTVKLAIATMAGGFLFPFLIRMVWGKMVEEWGPIGGWTAAGFLVGTAWAINHGVGMIHQTGAWIDQAWAAGIGLIVATCILGLKFKKAVPNIIGSILGGILGGFILSLFL